VASYNRPLVTRDYRAINAPFGAEYPMLRWLERNGYDVAYQAGVDTHSRGVGPATRLFVSVGHDEYWSGPQRTAVEAARDRGVHLAFFSGNEVYWRVRWEGGEAVGEEPRTMVCYKDSQATRRLDPVPGEWTGVWRDGRDINPLGADPENSLTGQIYVSDTWANYPIVVPPTFARHRFWRHTAVAAQALPRREEEAAAARAADEDEPEGVVLLKGLIGHEFDEDIDNGCRPAGLMRLSRTTVDNVVYLQDHAKVFDTGSATHALTLYRAASGALVFGAGTVQWSWGLDPHHDSPAGVPPHVANPYVTRVGRDLAGPDRAVQQATANLFADMGLAPATPAPALVLDPPAAPAWPPPPGYPRPASAVQTFDLGAGGELVVRGTAVVPAGGASLAAVEVSVDGGRAWHPADGQGPHGALTAWRWTSPTPWLAAAPTHGVLSRAVDDSGVLEETSH
jgi:hypothetical protein